MTPRAFVVAGLGYGDEGKGTVVDYLTRAYCARAVVRYNGGPQAAHFVVTPEGHTHCFSQVGAGSLLPGVRTHLSRFMLVEPLALLRECQQLASKGATDILERVSLDPRCPVVTPYHKLLGRMRELARGAERRGSVGLGVGEAARDAATLGGAVLQIGDLPSPKRSRARLATIRAVALDRAEQIAGRQPLGTPLGTLLAELRGSLDVVTLAAGYHRVVPRSGVSLRRDEQAIGQLAGQGPLVLEGAQGALLDRTRGFVPYVTQSNTTVEQALTLLSEAGLPTGPPEVEILGVLRPYATRHGPGPLATEDRELQVQLPDLHNGDHTWQGPFRVGAFDVLTTRYACALNPQLTSIALTNLDRLSGLERFRACCSYIYSSGGAVEPGPLDQVGGHFAIGEGHAATALRNIDTDGAGAGTTQVLRACRPDRFVELPGWDAPLADVGQWHELPVEALGVVHFLESSEGLGLPISLVSKGPTWLDKLRRQPTHRGSAAVVR